MCVRGVQQATLISITSSSWKCPPHFHHRCHHQKQRRFVYFNVYELFC